MIKDVTRFVPPYILSRCAYSPGYQPANHKDLIKLNTNENPFPPSPTVSDAVQNEISNLHLYPEPYSQKLRDLIASKHSLSEEQVIIGNGSDDLLNLCVRAFADTNRMVGMLEPSYSLYPTLTSLQRSKVSKVEFLNDEFKLPVEEITKSGVNLFFLTNPHAPSGRYFDQEAIFSIASEINAILVVDEAYADFSIENSIPLLDKANNLVITRTLSKSYSLAGSRVGFAISSPEIISILDSVREVYNLDRMSQAAAFAALSDVHYFEDCRRKILEEREKAYTFFTQLGWRTIESHANFILTEPINATGQVGKKSASSLFNYLEKNNIHVRYFHNHRLTESKIRISIGTERQMNVLYQTINKWCNEES